MPVFNIQHITKYEYDRPVKESVNEIKIYPVPDREQEVLFQQVNITGDPDILLVKDYWGNMTGMFNLMPAHKELVIESKLIVRTLGPSQNTLNKEAKPEDITKEIQNNLSLLELAKPKDIELKEKICEIIAQFHAPGMPVYDIIEKCGQYIYNNFKYIKGITNIETTTREILELR